MTAPQNWTHKRGYHLNADGKSIEYTHDEDDSLLAVVEAMVNEEEAELEYYTAIFDTSGGKPWATVESHEFHPDKEQAKSHLQDLMKKHA